MKNSAYTALLKLNEKGYEAYLVGGGVRNFLLNMEIHDYDITTNADPNAIRMIFNDYPIYDLGKKLGTVGVKIDDDIIEITPFRKEGRYDDHRHPNEIEFAEKLVDDLCRRDFTVNALCMDKDEKITDFYGGIDDLNNRIIRAIGNPDSRFNEDALRILRAIRFKSKLDFSIEENTEKSLFANKDLLKHISMERKKDELLQILSYKNAFDILREYKDIFDTFFKIERIDLEENIFTDPLYTMAYLYHLNSYEISSLKLSSKEEHLIKLLAGITDTDIHDDTAFIQALSNIYSLNCLEYLSEYHQIDLKKKYESLKEYIITINDLALDGKMLQELGYEGVKIGEVKNYLLDAVHCKKVENESSALLNYLKENRL